MRQKKKQKETAQSQSALINSKAQNFSHTLGLERSWRSDRLCRPAVVWSVKALRPREL